MPRSAQRSLGSTDFVEVLVGLQAEAAGDDFFLDLGGAAEDVLNNVSVDKMDRMRQQVGNQ
jgi:hypothetical protein